MALNVSYIEISLAAASSHCEYRSLPLAGCRVIILLALDVHDVRDVGQGKAMGRNTGFGGRDDSGNSTLP